MGRDTFTFSVGFSLITHERQNSCKPGIWQYYVTFYYRRSCEAWYPQQSQQSLDIGQNSDGDISDFRISGQSLLNKHCHNFRTSNEIDMKLGPATELVKRNVKFDDDIMFTNYDVIVIFSMYG